MPKRKQSEVDFNAALIDGWSPQSNQVNELPSLEILAENELHKKQSKKSRYDETSLPIEELSNEQFGKNLVLFVPMNQQNLFAR